MNSAAITRLAFALPLIALVVISGCIELPTDPAPIVIEGNPPEQIEEPQFVEVPPTSPLSGGGFFSDPVEVCFSIRGNEGTTLQLERFTLIVPPGAFEGEAEVCITIPDPEKMVCDLKITPESANDFRLPVKLVANCKDIIEAGQIGDLYILCYDETLEKWKEVPVKNIDTQSMTIQTQLSHFSRYGVAMGRSGW